MVFSISNIKNYVKGIELKQKWDQKKNNPFGLNQESTSNSIRQLLGNQKRYNVEAIKNKMRAGSKLSSGEMRYLRENHPDLYTQARRIAAEREDYERKLRQCKTKEEVSRLHTQTSASLLAQAKNAGADAEEFCMRSNAITKTHRGFTKSPEYSGLPKDYRELKERRKNERGDVKRTDAKDLWESRADTVENCLYNAWARKSGEVSDSHKFRQRPEAEATAPPAEPETPDAGQSDSTAKPAKETLTPIAATAYSRYDTATAVQRRKPPISIRT